HMLLTKAEIQPQNVLRGPVERAIESAGHIILGKEQQVRLALACLLARGHLLIEDLPGVGKTTLAHVLARSLGLQFQRIQFTSDMLPADILGVSIYERDTGGFKFHPGPIFAQVILADEVNRATPKTQSALLEAMEEHQVTAEGETRKLPEPFYVIATQNPSEQVGTFPLPESQLDRFMMRLELGYPDRDAAAAARRLAGPPRPRPAAPIRKRQKTGPSRGHRPLRAKAAPSPQRDPRAGEWGSWPARKRGGAAKRQGTKEKPGSEPAEAE